MKETVTVNTVVLIHEDEGYKTGLVVSVGRKFIGVIYPDSAGMRIRKLPLDSKYCATDYPAKRAKSKMRKCGKKFGITKSARLALQA